MKMSEVKTTVTLSPQVVKLLERHIKEAGIKITPTALAERVIRKVAKEGNLAEDYS